MNILTVENEEKLGQKAARLAADSLNEAIEEQGFARLLLSTGASQLTTINALIEQKVDWDKVEMFHLDEYVDLDESHAASFRKYLQDRFVSKVKLKNAHFVNANENVDEVVQKLTNEIRKAPIDVALVGIGENAHIGFNDPPADFKTTEAFIKVKLDNKCKNQQVREGWFPSIKDVPDYAITITVNQIMKSKKIISCVPYEVKAKAVNNTIKSDINNEVPSTILKTHPDWTLFLDNDSVQLLKK